MSQFITWPLSCLQPGSFTAQQSDSPPSSMHCFVFNAEESLFVRAESCGCDYCDARFNPGISRNSYNVTRPNWFLFVFNSFLSPGRGSSSPGVVSSVFCAQQILKFMTARHKLGGG